MDHDWDDRGPVYPGAAPVRGRYWRCVRCGMRIRSNGRPRTEKGLIRVVTPDRVVRLDPREHLPDCDQSVVRRVMES
jgi:DNA-directed RNA polymerase subunit RPC12/RpoP